MLTGLRHTLLERKYRFIVCVGIPTLLVLLYLVIFAAPTYRTETQIVVRENSTSGSSSLIPGFAANLLGGNIRSSLEDAYILVEYLHSSAVIEQVDAELGLRAHYASPRLDFIRRLATDAPAETVHEFYRNHVKIIINPQSSIVTLQVDAFDPAFAQKLAKALVAASERAINELNARMVGAQTALAERELIKTRENLMAARQRLLEFQIANSIIDPVGEMSSRLGTLAALDSRLVEKRTQLRTKEQFLRNDSFDVRSLQQEIAALDEQRTQENLRLVNPDDKSMAAAAQKYEDVKLAAEFTLNAFTAALALDEKAKLDAARQQKFLLPISAPFLPQEPAFPILLLNTITAFTLFSLLYAITRLIIATIRDHTL